MLGVIDLGAGSDAGRGRVWVFDPVDGTATFLRGNQYAICLALLEDGQEKIRVLGCPNLSFEGLLRKIFLEEDVEFMNVKSTRIALGGWCPLSWGTEYS
jgi:3'-phosphoadenosine 5'-phosphosulfate (PAPS) 3'-phosphatase